MTRCIPWEDYGDVVTWTNELEQLLSWYTDKTKPINLGFFYISEPDHTMHENDIFSPRVRGKLAELDALVANLVIKLKQYKLYDRMNIVFVADHGHSNTHTQQNSINFDEILSPHEYIWSSQSIFPRRGMISFLIGCSRIAGQLQKV